MLGQYSFPTVVLRQSVASYQLLQSNNLLPNIYSY